jgi:polyhydroxybutyrate depolymerase
VNLPTTAVPLVLVLHGGSEDAATTASEARPTKAWRDVADLEKFLLVYPDGLGNQWNDCRSDATDISSADDVGYLNALITRIAADRAIDPQRIYVAGVSNGGMMAYRLGLELSGRIAGLGAVIANLPVDPSGRCPRAASAALTVAIMNGTDDPLMPFTGGVVGLSPTRGTVRGAIETRDFWVAANGCNTAPATDVLPDLDASDGTTVTRQRFTGCRGNHQVVFFRVEGGGHTSPSRRYFTTGRQNRDIESADELWRVLKDARRN